MLSRLCYSYVNFKSSACIGTIVRPKVVCCVHVMMSFPGVESMKGTNYLNIYLNIFCFWLLLVAFKFPKYTLVNEKFTNEKMKVYEMKGSLKYPGSGYSKAKKATITS